MLRFWYLVVAMLIALSCTQDGNSSMPPIDHPYYPSAILQNADTMYVVSSNFDQRYRQANLLSIDLAKVDAALLQNVSVIGTDVVTSSAYIPSFTDGATLSPNKDKIVLVTRGEKAALRSIPLGPTNLIACPNATTALGQDCYSQEPALALRQSNPYYLTIFGDAGSDITGGVIGYLLDPVIYRANDKGNFLLPQYFEMERFTWNASDSTADIVARIGIGEKIRSPLVPGTNKRYNVRIGGVTQVDGYQYFLAERAPEAPQLPVEPQIVRISMADLQSAGPANITANAYDLSTRMSSIESSTLAVRALPDRLQFYVSNGLLGNLFQFEMSIAQPTDASGRLVLSLKNRSELCNRPTNMKLTPNQEKLIVTCDTGEILIFEASTLRVLDNDRASGPAYGRGPVKIHFDTRAPFSNRFYVANINDGSISVFEITEAPNTSQKVLTRRAHIFQPSLPNREGGAE